MGRHRVGVTAETVQMRGEDEGERFRERMAKPCRQIEASTAGAHGFVALAEELEKPRGDDARADPRIVVAVHRGQSGVGAGFVEGDPVTGVLQGLDGGALHEPGGPEGMMRLQHEGRVAGLLGLRAEPLAQQRRRR